MKRHLISAADLTRDDALLVLDTAEEMARVADRPIKKLPTLRGRTVVNLFFEDSTRTRISFEAAAKRLSADVINFSAKGSSVSKGESLKDTALTLEAMGADAVVIRHHSSGAPHRLATSGWINGVGGQRRRRHPRAPHAGAARRLHDAPPPVRRRPRPGRPPDHDRRRRAAQPGRPLQRAAADHARRPGHPGRPAHPAADRRRALAVRGVVRPGRRARQVRRGDDAAGAARADERRLLPHRARVRPPLRPGRPADGRAARARHRDAPRADEPRHGDHRRGRRLPALHRRRAGRQRRQHPDGRALPAARRLRARPRHRPAAAAAGRARPAVAARTEESK